MGGSSQQQSETRSQSPWDPAQPSLMRSLSAANNAFDTTYTQPSVAPVDPFVAHGQNMALARAQTGQIGGMADDSGGILRSIINGGGLSGEQNAAVGGINTALGGFNDQSAKVSGYLTPFADGSMRGSNPYLDKAISDSMGDASAATNRMFTSAGRTGSGAHIGVLADRLGKIANDARMGAYETDSNRQLQASQQLAGVNDSMLSGNLSGQGALSAIGQQRLSNTSGILGLLPTLQGAQNLDADTMTRIGGQRMDYNQRTTDAANQDPWTRAQSLAQIAQGIGGMGGTTVSQGQRSSDPGVMGTIGGITSGLGAIGNLGSSLGGFASLFALSDERAKENIEPVGKLNDGQKIYAYNYKGDGRPQIGLLAQEVEKVVPDAVQTDPASGYKMVHYGRATRRVREKEAA